MHLNINPVLHLLRGEVLRGVALVLNIDTNHIELISYKVKEVLLQLFTLAKRLSVSALISALGKCQLFPVHSKLDLIKVTRCHFHHQGHLWSRRSGSLWKSNSNGGEVQVLDVSSSYERFTSSCRASRVCFRSLVCKELEKLLTFS